VERRIMGIENEYGVTCTFRGQRRLSPDEVARYLFRRVVSWGRSSNVFLRNGARLYLDVGSHPEYATPECDSAVDLVTHDKAGERILEGLLMDAERRLREEGIAGDIYLFKNNTDSAGNSYGCHENYLVGRQGEFSRLADVLIPFLVSRQIVVGAGKVLQTPRGAVYCVSQRAEHIWEGVSSATTRSRPIINTRDEPHADAERFRPPARHRRRQQHERDDDAAQGRRHRPRPAHGRGRRHDARPDAGEPDPGDPRDQPRPHRAAQGQARQRPGGQRARDPARVPQPASDFIDRRGGDATVRAVLDLWGRTLQAVETGDLSLVDREIDWVTKHQLIERYRAKHDLPLSSPRIAQLDLAYHDVNRHRGLYYLLENKGLVERATTDLAVFEAKSLPPQTTRARLRGEFIRCAQEKRRDFTVDWVHLKLNDQAQRTVLCKDPFRSVDDRVDKLIASM
jgi:proteasome accessory factor A